MTELEYELMSLEDLIEWCYYNADEVVSRETLLDFAKEMIDCDRLFVAIHILKAIQESQVAEYYRYDFNMGTLENPTPITSKDDLADLVYFTAE